MIPLQLSCSVRRRQGSLHLTAPRMSPRWSVSAGITALIVGAAMIGGGFFVLVQGLEKHWPVVGRGLAFVVLFEGVGVLLAGLHRFIGIGDWVTNQGRSF